MRAAIAGGAVFHLVATLVMYSAGPRISLSRLFPDSDIYGSQITIAAQVFTNAGTAAWFFSLLPFHVKLYSLCFVLLGRWLDVIRACEPLNAFYYVTILYLVFALGRRIFDPGTGLLAALIVALWPSFLAHTTQPLKDPLFIVLALLYLTINSLWLKRDYSLRAAVLIVAGGIVTEFFLWLVKSDMWPLMIVFGLLTCLLLLAKMIRAQKVVPGNLAGALLLALMSIIIPRAAVLLYRPAITWAESRGVASLYQSGEEVRVNAVVVPAPPVAAFPGSQISELRQRFILSYPAAGSNIDSDVQFITAGDIVRYLPRATMIGLFAPFPNMWFAARSRNGRLGRIIGAAEMVALYGLEVFALIGFWQKRRELLAWWLLLVPVIGIVALGLVVTNVGALYRMRYIFVMLLVILASYGITQVYRLLVKRKTDAQELAFS